jgi:hypothetical protein
MEDICAPTDLDLDPISNGDVDKIGLCLVFGDLVHQKPARTVLKLNLRRCPAGRWGGCLYRRDRRQSSVTIATDPARAIFT